MGIVHSFQKGEKMYTTNYQEIVTRMVFGEGTRFPELDCQKRAMVNTYIEHRGHYSIHKHPELIRDSWEAVLQSAKVSAENKTFEMEEE